MASDKNGIVFAKLLVIAVLVHLSKSDIMEQPDFNIVESDQMTPIVLIADNAYDKRNNVNKFKNMMINKDNPNSYVEDTRDEQIYYIPRVASGKKRGAILSWAIPTNKVTRYGNSNYRPVNGMAVNSRPAAR